MLPAPACLRPACRSCQATVSNHLAAGLCPKCLASHTLQRTTHEDASWLDLAEVRLPPGFDLVEVLGRGGMGVVYLAFQRNLGRYVALKQLAGNFPNLPRARERLLREAQAAARIAHPGIVPILEVGQQGDAVWFTMEFMEGGDLSQWLQRQGGRLPWPDAARLVQSIATAIQSAHEAGVAHCDLKPSNILLDPAGHPHVSDFGVAWVAGQEALELTKSGEMLGTPAYTAPENLAGGTRSRDAFKADQYSLGALLFHLLAGRPPFTGRLLEILGALATQPAPLLADVVREPESIPRALHHLCQRSLQRDPADRYPSVRHLCDALEACLQGTPPPPWRDPPTSRRRRYLLATAAATLAVGACVAIWPPRAFHTRPSQATPVQPPIEREASPIVAVMPLECLERDEASLLLAAGLQEEIISALVRLSDVRVITAGSTRLLTGDLHDAQTVRRQLGAHWLLAGSLRREGDEIRLHARLTDTLSGITAWSRTFQRQETRLLNLQTDIATDVAIQLRGPLYPERAAAQRGAISAHPGAQARVHRAHLLASDASNSIRSLDEAERLLREAVALDPGFALAHAMLSLVHTQKFQWGNDRSSRRLEQALESAQLAQKLNPALPEASLALGSYYWRGFHDAATARPHLERALRLAPGHAGARTLIAGLNRREGRFAEAAEQFRAALEVDPLNAHLAYNTADTFLRLRDYATAAQLLAAAQARLPDSLQLRKLTADLELCWHGDTGPMRAELDGRHGDLPTPEGRIYDEIQCLIFEQRVSAALAYLRQSTFHVLEGQSVYLTRDGFEAELLYLAGDLPGARAAAERAWPMIERELAQRPHDPRILLHHAQILMSLGRLAEAEGEARRPLTPGDPARVDAFERGFYLRALAVMLAESGADSSVYPLLEEVLKTPDQSSEHSLRLHPALRRFF